MLYGTTGAQRALWRAWPCVPAKRRHLTERPPLSTALRQAPRVGASRRDYLARAADPPAERVACPHARADNQGKPARRLAMRPTRESGHRLGAGNKSVAGTLFGLPLPNAAK